MVFVWRQVISQCALDILSYAPQENEIQPLRGWTISGRAGRYLAIGKTISSLRSDSDRAALLVIEAAEDNPDDIDELPDDEAAACDKLEDAGDDFTGIDAVHPAEAAEKE